MPKRDIGGAEKKKSKESELVVSEGKGISDDSDLSDSEESVYSGLENEESTSDDENEKDIEQSDEEEDSSDEKDEESEILSSSNDEGNLENVISESYEEPVSRNIKGDRIEESKGKQLAVQSKAIFEDADTSDEEDVRNTVGNIPIEWYNEYPHIGYNLEGKKILKPAQGDELDTFLSKMDDPDYWKTVYDKTNMEDIKLTNEELEIIQKIQSSAYPGNDTNPYEPYVDWFTGEKMIHPISEAPPTKTSFIPSKWEHKRVIKIVRAIRNGWIKPKAQKDDKKSFYLLWNKDDQSKEMHPMHWPAPKLKLPGHEESYNPLPEYLPTEEEVAAWKDMDPDQRTKNFLPTKYGCLRHVPGYSNFIQERFERCLDLYLCPRRQKIRLQVDPEDLIPKLPRPKDLQPFPSAETLFALETKSLADQCKNRQPLGPLTYQHHSNYQYETTICKVYRGHEAAVHCISVNSSGQWLASGGGDETIRFWEISTSRCMKTISVSGNVHSIKWNPNPNLCVVAAAVDNTLLLINPYLGDKLILRNTDNTLNSYMSEVVEDSYFNQDVQQTFLHNFGQGNKEVDSNLAKWFSPSSKDYQNGYRIQISHEKAVKQVTWHNKGDYLAVVIPEGGNKSVIIHQLSKRRSQCPFSKAKGIIQIIQFHPKRPFLFVATQRYIRVYNLQKQILTKKLLSGVKWISSMAIHPQGDNLIIGSYDKRLCWFDMDLSSKPYKILRHHKKAIRQVSFHKSYPLFASASDDGTLIVCHGKVYSDLMQNPLIVPVKVIRGHKITENLDADVTKSRKQEDPED